MKKMMTALAIAAGLASPLAAQDWPSGTVSIVVPYSPSGNTDILARHMAPYLEEKWGQPVVIDNRPGGGSMVGTAQVSQANPDGLTLLVTTSAFVTAPAIQPDLPFDPRTDLTPIANVGYVSYILVTQGDSPFDTLEELVADSKENPKFAATAGLGTTTHFAIEQFIAQSGANFDVVHFKGGGPAVVAILSGEADIYGSSVSSAGDNIASGKVKVLAVLGNDRIDALPDVPSTAELGYPETEIHQWVGVFAPGGTDPEIVAKINADINEVLRNEEFIAKVTPLDWTLEQSTPEGFAAEVDQELTSWKKLAEDQGISK
ncbi:tripartite tricarboxylate transporter substrate binding protein [Oceanicola sp. 502str15]|uniref:Bug family tripartite tricarboxylate transporter substrate binding protein n=1 Tax=Oceanicola sp. 502str15 TaxID=2696061 RepID=UPI002094A03A|nr:tripartite tricarboxylate transporter substrate binding protein [Oceanicola sp. 502str15]MCO6383034.1 tripartite tricarboxylate transporter substrate binding protein [Oceanicola sp. 502str15]